MVHHILAIPSAAPVITNFALFENTAEHRPALCPQNLPQHVEDIVLKTHAVLSIDAVKIKFPLAEKTIDVNAEV